MSILEHPIHGEALSILQGRDASVLAAISQPGIAATLWQRRPTEGFSRWIEDLQPDCLPRLRTLVGVDALEGCIHAACDNAGTPSGPHRDMLAGDIAALGVLMGQIMETPMVHVRLDVVSNNACRRFHVNAVAARMLCTYRGAGTEIARPGNEERPMSVATGSAVLLRGKLWPGPEETRLLHRSPPIEGSGETRLLIVMDPALDRVSREPPQ